MANILMFEETRLCVVGEMGKLKGFDYTSRYGTENLGLKYAQTLTY